MKISGFTFVRNVHKLYYPIKESIASVLPIVDEYVIALGKGDEDDNTLAEIESLNSPKIKIIHTVWDLEKYPRGMEHAHQTDIAKEACTGDWLIYLQADEVIHEKYLPTIQKASEYYLDKPEIEGFLFKYKHFWGDYWHYHNSHGWYPREIRLIRNLPEIHSFQSAQTFRRIPDFDGLSYKSKEGTFKLKVALIDAFIYHYGWVRPPKYMQSKQKTLNTNHQGKAKAEAWYKEKGEAFDYGGLGALTKFTETHPKVMEEWIAKFNWKDELNYSKKTENPHDLLIHLRPRYKFLTFIEKKIFGWKNKELGYNNWKIVDKFKS